MLAVPSYAFAMCANNWFTSTPHATTVGTILGDPGATPHTKSATTALLSALAHPGFWVEIQIVGTHATGIDTSALLDIMYDPAGGTAWSVLIPDLICGFRRNAQLDIPPGNTYRFPLYIPRGATLGARWQSLVVSPAAGTRPRVLISVFGGPSTPGFWVGSKVTAVGVDAAASTGLDVDPGSTGTYGSFVSIGGTTNPAFKFLTVGVQGSVDTHTADVYHLQYGFGGVQVPGGVIRFGYTANEQICVNPDHGGVWVDIAGGTQLQVCATGSDATSEDPSVILYGVS